MLRYWHDMKTLPNTVKFIKYHMRHVAIFDPKNTFPHIQDFHQSYGAEHAASMTGTPLVWPEEQGRQWLKANGYTFTGEGDKHGTGEIWGRA